MNTREKLNYVINLLYDLLNGVERTTTTSDIYYAIGLLEEIESEDNRNTRPGIYQS